MSSNGTRDSSQPAAEASLLARLQKLPDWANRDEALVYRGRYVTAEFQIFVGSSSCFVSIVEGKVQRVRNGPQRMRPSSFIVSASPEAWTRFWQPVPEPWWHDLFAMNKKGNATIEGDLHLFMANLQYFKDLLALPRRMTGAH